MSVPPTMKSNGLQFTSELTKVATRNTLRIMSVKSVMRRTRFGFDKVNIFVRFGLVKLRISFEKRKIG